MGSLDSLAETERLIIKQKVELMEAFAQAAANAVDLDALGAFGETANKYDVYTDDGGLKYKVVEQSDLCGWTGRACCRPNHQLKLHVYHPESSDKKEMMIIDRPCKCSSPCKCSCFACCDICRQEMTVYEGASEDDGNIIGYVKQPILGGFLSPQLEIMDREDGDHIATVTSSATCCLGGICCDHTFEVTDPDGNNMGKIVKERPEGLAEVAKELGTDADNFTLYVPRDWDVRKKAAVFSSLYLIDYMFFENEGDVNLDIVNGACTCKICDCYCCGCICPCSCACEPGECEYELADE